MRMSISLDKARRRAGREGRAQTSLLVARVCPAPSNVAGAGDSQSRLASAPII